MPCIAKKVLATKELSSALKGSKTYDLNQTPTRG